MSLTYRSDVDGLRALAVIPVLLFHIGISTGGFVGVDIFFVISGFLITSLIVREQAAGGFSIAGFYERRVRRIAPALLLVLATFLVLSIFALAPSDRENLGKTTLLALASISNFHFAFDVDYFRRGADVQPLLHTWSLGVEEQFYLVFPLLVTFLARRRVSMPLVFWGLFALSLAFSSYGALNNSTADFYLLPSRAWELLTGSLLAIGAVPKVTSRLGREALGLVGLALVAGSVLLINGLTPFPGIGALAPCLGAAALIHAGVSGPNLASRLLSLKPMVAVGLISYSLYLWHWPILTFQRMGWTFFPYDSKIGAGIVVIGLSVIASWLTWRFVEQPFRGKRMPTRKVMTILGVAALAIAALATVLFATKGLPDLLPNQAGPYAKYVSYNADINQRRGICLLWKRKDSRLDDAACLTPAGDRPNILIIGDSHAANLWLGLHEVFPEYHFLQATAASCKPLPVQTGPTWDRCDELTKRVYEDFLPGRPVDAVVLMGNWKADDVKPVARAAQRIRAMGMKVIWVGPLVQYDQEAPRLLNLAAKRQDPSILDRHRKPGPRQVDALMATKAVETGIPYYSVVNALCDAKTCKTTSNGAPIQYDGAHMTGEGSRYIAAALRQRGVFSALAE